jgi:hypothetical protein
MRAQCDTTGTQKWDSRWVASSITEDEISRWGSNIMEDESRTQQLEESEEWMMGQSKGAVGRVESVRP